MNTNRIAKSMAVAIGFILLFAVAGLAHGQSAQPSAAQAPWAVSPGNSPKEDSYPQDDFAGLNYTDEQKAEIDEIHRDTEMRKNAVVKDQNLNEDQKNAMLLGYTRIEYGRTFKVLSPEQQKQVRQRIRTRRMMDQAARSKQHP